MKFAVIDFETTGSGSTDEIIQVGLVIIDEFEIIERYSSLIKPTVTIPTFITQLTGIDVGMVEDAPSIDDVIPEIQRRIYDCTLVAHQASFDLGFLQRALDLCGYSPFSGRVLDTMDVLPIAFPTLPGYSLSVVANALNIEHERPHQADSDAEVTALVWLRCIQKLLQLPLLTLQRVAELFAGDFSDTKWLLEELLRIKELSVHQDDDSYRYYRQFALSIDDWGTEDLIRDPETFNQLTSTTFDSFYEEIKQSLRNKFEQYEERDAQDQMLQQVNASFEDDYHLMIEAGTGTGKSLGYLIPALYYAMKQEKKVIVSTHTINLQEQIRNRDIPLLHDIFPIPFKASLLKGRSHYLCLRKFEQKITTQDFEPLKDERVSAAQMVVWLGETKQGDDEELYFGNRGSEFWHSVSSDADSCLNRACPWFKKCFYHRARHDAGEADVVITNHSLLFTDVKAESRILPTYKDLVIDEAHHFEDVASKHLGFELSYSMFNQVITRLYKDAKTGQLPTLRFRLSRLTDEWAEKAIPFIKKIDDLYIPILETKQSFDELTTMLFAALQAMQPADSGEFGQLVYRIKADSLPVFWDDLMVIEENIYLLLGGVIKQVERLVNTFKEQEDEQALVAAATDLSGTLKDMQRIRDHLHFFVQRTDPNFVYWLEASITYKAKSIQFVGVPIDVSPMLREHFFNVKDSVIMTSATLSVDKKFDYTCEQFGLDPINDHVRTVMLPSPFQYRRQALVVIPRDFPTLKGASGDAYFIACLIQSVRDVAIQTKGRMLVLFTSNRMLRQVHPELKEQLHPYGIQVLGQGVDSNNRSKLVKLFQDQPQSVLLGTSSFWEGVDIPGDALTALVIVRLPFQPPTHPVVEAKSEYLKQNGKNPFLKLSIPQAVIRFKQGFGRLVRTARDRGIVIVYDTRILDSYYGKYFLYSLPGPKIEHLKSENLVSRIKQWMEGEDSIEDNEYI